MQTIKKIFQFSWVPIVGAALVITIYGSALISQNQKQNATLISKIDQLAKQVDRLQGGVQVAGVSTSAPIENPTPKPTNKITVHVTATPEVTPGPSTSPTSTPTPTPSPTKTPSPMPSPTPTPTPTPVQKQVTVEIQNQGSYTVNLQNGDTALSVLERASQENNFSLDYIDYGSMGMMVNGIGGVSAHDNYYWAFYYNGAYAQVGASAQVVNDGDIISWKFETF